MSDFFKQVKNGFLLDVKVTPNTSKTELIKTDTGVKARLNCAPVDGKANNALIALLSKEFDICKSNIQIVKGLTSKNKTILFLVSEMPKI